MSTLTVLTLVPDAGDRLERCLSSVAWADDLFCVVDPRTSDGSDAIARKHSNHVVSHPYENAAAQRNWALPQITSEWTLVLDADEWVSEELANRIRGIVATPGGPDGHDIRRQSYFFGKRIRGCGWQHDHNLRLFRTSKGHYLDRRVHSRVVVDGTVGRINEPMYHDAYRDFDEYFRTFHRFTLWGAQDLHERGVRPTLADLTLRPAARFIKMFILRGGWRDGSHGAVLCGLAAFSVFMKYARLWHLRLGGGPLPPKTD